MIYLTGYCDIRNSLKKDFVKGSRKILNLQL